MISVVAKSTLSDADRDAIAALLGALRDQGIDPRISLETLTSDPDAAPLLALDGARLVGIAAPARFGDTAEVALALAPDAPHDTGEVLLAALPDALGPGVRQIVLLNDRTAKNLAALYRARGFAPDHAEQVLRLPAGTRVTPAPTRLDVRAAEPSDLPLVVELLAREWAAPLEVAQQMVTRNVEQSGVTYYLALLGETPVAALNVQQLEGRPWIYGFVVSEAQRGQGFGRQMLTHVLATELRASPGDVFLEVDAVNQVAQNLYRSLGFIDVRTFEYWSRRM